MAGDRGGHRADDSVGRGPGASVPQIVAMTNRETVHAETRRSGERHDIGQNARMIRFEGTLTPEMYRRALGVTGRPIRMFAWIWIVVGIIALSSAHLDRPVTWGAPL